jgi:hypothetical protein
MTNGVVLQDELKRSLRWLTIATVVLYLMLAGVGAFLIVSLNSQQNKLQQVTDTTTGALCAFVHDLERRVETTVQFLEENPDGVGALSAAVIRQSLANQRQTLVSLESLQCPPEPLGT